MQLLATDIDHNEIQKRIVLGDFNSFPMSLLALFQVLIGAGWHVVMFKWAQVHNAYYMSMFYFVTFYCFAVIVTLSLLTALIWEVFTIVETATEKDDDKALNRQSTSIQKKKVSQAFQGVEIQSKNLSISLDNEPIQVDKQHVPVEQGDVQKTVN